MTDLRLSNSKESLFPCLLGASTELVPTRTPCSQALVSLPHLCPKHHQPGGTERGQGKREDPTLVWHTHTHSSLVHNSSESEPPKKEENGTGEGLVKTTSCQAPLTTVRLSEKEKRQRSRKERGKGRQSYAVFSSHVLSSYLGLHKTKAPNSAHLSPLLSQEHFPRAPFPLKHTSLLPALLEPGLGSHILWNQKINTDWI